MAIRKKPPAAIALLDARGPEAAALALAFGGAPPAHESGLAFLGGEREKDGACAWAGGPAPAQAKRLLAAAKADLVPALRGRKDGEASALLALCEAAAGDFGAALARMEKRPPKDRALAAYLRALLSLGLDQDGEGEELDAALEGLAASLQRTPSARGYALLAWAEFERDRHEASLQRAEAALALEPRDMLASAWLMESAVRLGLGPRAQAEARRSAALFPELGFVQARAGRILGILGVRQEALRLLARAKALNPRCGVFRAWNSELLRREERAEESRAELEEAAALDPDYYLTFTWRGRARQAAGDLAGALADYARALELRPEDLRTRAWRAGALWLSGDCRAAALEFEAIPREPSTTWNRGPRADELARVSPEKLRGAGDPFWRDLDAQVERRPSDAWAWAFRGRCRLGAGRREEALADLDRALELEPGLGYAARWKAKASGA